MRGNTIELMRQFDALIDGIPNIFEEGTDVIDVSKLGDSISREEYTDFGGNVFGRFVEHRDDIKFPEEEQARGLLKSIPVDGPEKYIMFCRFNRGGVMKLQCHPQQEEGWLLDGGLACRHSSRRWVKGQKFFFERMEKHEPYTPSGCFLLLVFTGV